MTDVALHDVQNHVYLLKKEADVVEAAAVVANAIHAGLGGMIKGTLMEQDLRDALGLKSRELVNIPKQDSAGGKHG